MSIRHQNPSEHDPAISALYRKADDLAPPFPLDEAILATAHHAARQRRQRWVLPLSTAAVVMLSVTVLMNMHDEWDFSRELADNAPTSQPSPSASSHTERQLAEKTESASDNAPRQLAREEDSVDSAPAEMRAQKPAPATPPTVEAKARIASPPAMANAPSSEQPQQAARLKAESDSTLAFTDALSDLSGAVEQEADYKRKSAASPQNTERPQATTIAPAEQEVLEPKPWLEKIRKLLKATKKDDARKELEAFKKRYPDYKLPADLTSL